MLSRVLRYKFLRQPGAGLATVSYRKDRVSLWMQEAKRQQEAQLLVTQDALERAEPLELAVQSPAGQTFVFRGVTGVSTSIDVLKHMKELDLPKFQALASMMKDTGEVLDLQTPLERSGTLQLLDFSSDEGKSIFWHSSAHVLGQALENKFEDKIRLTDGPSLKEGGFFYEMFLQDGLTVSEADFDALHRGVKNIVKARQPFERLLVTRKFAEQLFEYSEFKRDMMQTIPDGEAISLYRCGPLIDLCRGPHVPHTGMLSSFEITRCGASHWKGKELLQRVYAISFPNNAQLVEWRTSQEEARKRDHRLIGHAQQLFMFHPLSPGSSFFLPHGTRVFNALVDFIRGEYRRRGYSEVISPLIFKKELWETSGHLKNYHDDMFMVTQGIATDSKTCQGHGREFEEETDQFGMKPMNCPGHCLIFREAQTYSYRDLPVRLADFSALHRNEASGALTGLTRVRRFHQDDAHIFCTAAQVQSEILQALDFIKHVYGIFDFSFNLRFSTRPDHYMGELELWDDAEDQLQVALDKFGEPWSVNEGDGAFYGPKIDVVVTDALNRQHQCGTIQLDFQLPINFELKYDGPDGKPHTPIIIHRAVLGSIERMMAILIEHTGGKWPLWLSPRQIAVLPIAEAHHNYANEVASKLQNVSHRGLFVDVRDGSKTLNKRVREAQVLGYNYILVVGDKEQSSNKVNIRTRDNKVHGAKPLTDFIEDIKAAIDRLE
ncbi:threonine-trna ligase [Plasmopara halstedii]|uniref:threonine--tRNA ligase n=1 Tax=Plasmopara halstedii TaxID=4781 RepID=A0A0P1ARG2_PLAHL|nr:threonine-trna ligase [Plasmopara halstedii]CEG43879.1 threonine-trna ligase [Plasmopara halstedii]|eukprot:XP_024580248.1 threonine-trna ligase [Plasmopara halstedii]